MQPPTHELRKEWRRLSQETRRQAMDVVRKIPRVSETHEVIAELCTLGLSPELSQWVIDRSVELRGNFIARQVERELSVTAIDYFNKLLIWLVITIVGIIWIIQEHHLLQQRVFSVGLPFALILTAIGYSGTVASFRKWLAAMKDRRSQ